LSASIVRPTISEIGTGTGNGIGHILAHATLGVKCWFDLTSGMLAQGTQAMHSTQT